MNILRHLPSIAVAIGLLVFGLALAVAIAPFMLICVGGAWVWGKLGWQRAKKQLVDPTFGRMTCDGEWYTDGEHVLERLGRFTIVVSAPWATGPSAAQRAVLHGIIERQDDLRGQVEAELYRQNRFVALQFRQDMEGIMSKETLDGICPLAKEPSDVWRWLSDGSIYIEKEPASFSMSWNCAWDEEHGVSLRFEDWKLVEECN